MGSGHSYLQNMPVAPPAVVAPVAPVAPMALSYLQDLRFEPVFQLQNLWSENEWAYNYYDSDKNTEKYLKQANALKNKAAKAAILTKVGELRAIVDQMKTTKEEKPFDALSSKFIKIEDDVLAKFKKAHLLLMI